jgi:transcription initiation factor IIF auxiliary subunit
MDLYIEAENLLHTSVSGIQSLEPGNDAPSTQACLELLQDLHNRILDRQDHVVAAVAERDKRYKKTEVQPLYAAGNIPKMKAVEKHFENAEKQAIVRARRDKAGRAGELVGIAEEVVVGAVGVEQREIDAIVAAIRDLDDASGEPDLLALAQDTVSHLKSSSKSLLSLFNTMEITHNAAVLDAEIAQAKLENADASRVKQLEDEKAQGEKKFMDEFNRRVEVIEQDKAEIEGLIAEKGGKGFEEVEREKRLKAALEEAKRRNGHA